MHGGQHGTRSAQTVKKRSNRRNAKVAAKRKALARQDGQSAAGQIARTAAAPILHCCRQDVPTDQGIESVLWSRLASDGRVGYVVFLVDRFCLGVKDIIWGVARRTDYELGVYGRLYRDYRAVPLEPAYARKLIEGAVDYARELGLAPYKDYSRAKAIFGDVDASTCRESIEYGKDGKPFFIAGPNENLARCRQIIDTLANHCEPGAFDYLVQFRSSELGGEIGELAPDVLLEEFDE